MKTRFTILGCGSSGGVPRIGEMWGDCDPGNPKNWRRRCSLLVQQSSLSGTTQVLIDSSPDLREQLLGAGVGVLDGVVYTHAHADHVNGLDDLRMVFHNRGSQVPVWADRATGKALLERFGYAFSQPKGSNYPPILSLNLITGPVVVPGDGGQLILNPFRVAHGEIESKGFRVGNLAYLPDVSDIFEQTWERLAGLDCWIIDALRRKPHPSHTHLEKTLEWIEKVAPRRAILTNMHSDLDYETLLSETPDNVVPAFDGMIIEYEY